MPQDRILHVTNELLDGNITVSEYKKSIADAGESPRPIREKMHGDGQRVTSSIGGALNQVVTNLGIRRK